MKKQLCFCRLCLVVITVALAVAGCAASETISATAGSDGAYAPPPPDFAPPADDISPVRALQNNAWRLVSYGDAGATRRISSDIDINIRFTGDNRIAGRGACNSFFTSYELGSGDAMSLGKITPSRRMCAGDIMLIEREFFGLLQRVSSYALSDGGLHLFDNRGNGVLYFASI